MTHFKSVRALRTACKCSLTSTSREHLVRCFISWYANANRSQNYDAVNPGSMSDWHLNLIKYDIEHEPKRDGDTGKLYTESPVELFRIIHEQYELVERTGNYQIVSRVLLGQISSIREYSEVQLSMIRKIIENPDASKLTLEQLSAIINNGAQCYDFALQLTNLVRQSETLHHHHVEIIKRLDLDSLCQAFIEISRSAVTATAELIFNDPGMKQLYQTFLDSHEVDTSYTETLLETLRDYFHDLERYLEKGTNPKVPHAKKLHRFTSTALV
eukprot:scaffold1006_cov408-Prasinococcus_capsulatus_cf.AAC.17